MAEISGRLRALALYFADRRGQLITREALLRDVFGHDPKSNLANVYISRFRRILGPEDQLETIYQKGWVLMPRKEA